LLNPALPKISKNLPRLIQTMLSSTPKPQNPKTPVQLFWILDSKILSVDHLSPHLNIKVCSFFVLESLLMLFLLQNQISVSSFSNHSGHLVVFNSEFLHYFLLSLILLCEVLFINVLVLSVTNDLSIWKLQLTSIKHLNLREVVSNLVVLRMHALSVPLNELFSLLLIQMC